MNVALLKVATTGAAILLGGGISAKAAELRVFFEAAARGAYDQIAPQFEVASGHKLITEFDLAPNMIAKIDAGSPFDAIFLVGDFSSLVGQSKVRSGSQVVLGRIGVGFAIPQGAARPDISSAEAVRRTLLDAKAIATSGAGGSGRYVLTLLDRLGIADRVAPKIKSGPAGSAAQFVARREVEFAVIGLAPVIGVSGVEWIGYLPAELQNWLPFTGGVSATAKEAEAAEGLLRFFSSSVVALKANGVEQSAP
jgi:molybdate transport system substrate-binding protein